MAKLSAKRKKRKTNIVSDRRFDQLLRRNKAGMSRKERIKAAGGGTYRKGGRTRVANPDYFDDVGSGK